MKDSEERKKLVAEVQNLKKRHWKLHRVISKLRRGMENSRSAEATFMKPRIDALKSKKLQEWIRLKQYTVKHHLSVESEDLEVRTTSDDVKKWFFSNKPGKEEGESSNLDEFKKVDQDSDLEKKMMGKKVVEGGMSCSSNDHPPLNLDHFKKGQDSDLQYKKEMEGFETRVLELRDAMKSMVSHTTDVLLKLKMLGNCSSSKDVKSGETSRITTLLDLIAQEVGKMATQDQMVESQETGFRSSKVVLLFHKILQLTDPQVEVKGEFVAVETSFEKFERSVKDSSDDMKSRIVKLRALKEEGLKNCEKEVKEMGPVVKELKETVMFGSEHESVIQTYFQSVGDKMVGFCVDKIYLARKKRREKLKKRRSQKR